MELNLSITMPDNITGHEATEALRSAAQRASEWVTQHGLPAVDGEQPEFRLVSIDRTRISATFFRSE